MPSPQKVLKDILRHIRPNKDQRRLISRLSRKTLLLTQRAAKKYKAKAMLAGSVTRDTWMPDKLEFDVFVIFPEKMKEKRMEETGLQIGKSVINKLKGKWEIAYAEHPYVSGIVDGVDIDIVPAFAVESAEKIKSAVDRTPFHVKYIEKNLPFKLSDEVRLLKQFLKAHGLYGADAKTEGFSGYVCELLIIQHRSFLNVLKSAGKWRAGETIDIGKHYDKKHIAEVWKNFRNQALILIDPTDKNRNAAAALSAANFFRFKKHAQEFLKNPSREFFFPPKKQPLTEKELVELLTHRRTELIIVKFIPPKTVPDVLWPQLRKFSERLKNILEETKYEFRVFGTDVFTDETFIATVLLEMEVSHLPTVQKRTGPSVFDEKDSKNFLEKYKENNVAGPYVEGSQWVVETKRQFLTAREKIQDSLSKELEVLKAKGIPNLIAERIAKGFEVIVETDKISEESSRNPDFGIFLRKYFEKEKLV